MTYTPLCKIIIDLEEKVNSYENAITEMAQVIEVAIQSNDQLVQSGEFWMKKAYELKEYVEQLERKMKNDPGLN